MAVNDLAAVKNDTVLLVNGQLKASSLNVAAAGPSEIGMAGDTFESVRVAATLHDIGKMYVPAEILTKPGKLAPVVDRTYALGEAADAFRYLGEGHAQGKVVITV